MNKEDRKILFKLSLNFDKRNAEYLIKDTDNFTDLSPEKQKSFLKKHEQKIKVFLEENFKDK